ncbi:hypothetical protein FRC08_000807 [Ceratobasidium sp. 394]|nr:hypothetical protein FRC08_000807 [Ceratobasidium sp. 394]KAG9096136.1 hypothetical protein FS749_009075 [Ceratobasidium sp. UAMH 11750]
MSNVPSASARAQASATPITPDHARIMAQLGPILPVVFKTGPRPKGTPGKKDFNMRDVLGLSGPTYTHVLENIRKLCILYGLDMGKTITSQEKSRLHTLYSEAIRVYPGFSEFKDPVWPVEAFVYVVLKGGSEKSKRVSAQAQAGTDAGLPASDPAPLAAGREARRENMRKSALARSAARKAAQATVDEVATEGRADPVEHVLGNMSAMAIGQDNALPDNPAVVSAPPVPAGGPSIVPVSAASTPAPARPRPRPVILPPAANSAAEPAHNPSNTTNADAPATTPVPVILASTPAPTSTSVTPAGPSAGASTATQVPINNQAPIPPNLSGAPASVLARIPASLLPLGSPDPDTLDDDEDSLSDVPPDPVETQTKGKRGSKAAKTSAPKTTAKKAKADKPAPTRASTRRTTKA